MISLMVSQRFFSRHLENKSNLIMISDPLAEKKEHTTNEKLKTCGLKCYKGQMKADVIINFLIRF